MKHLKPGWSTFCSIKAELQHYCGSILFSFVRLFLFFWLFSLSELTSAAPRVALLLSSDNQAYEQVANAAHVELSHQAPGLEVVTQTVNTEQVVLSAETLSADWIIAIGTQASRLALAAPKKPRVITTFVTHKFLDSLTETNAGQRAAWAGAVVLDQPADRLFQLSKLIAPDTQRVGMLLGELSGARLPEFQQSAQAHQIHLAHYQLQPSENPVKKLEPLIENSQAYIVLPDRTEFNRATARWIIYLSYRHAVPVIGYSSRYIDAGALASLYSTPAQLGRQAAEQLLQLNSDATARAAIEYPKYFDVRVNNKLKRTLGYSKLDENALKAELVAYERRTSLDRQEGITPDE